MEKKINIIRYIIGILFLLIGCGLLLYYHDYYLTFSEQQISSPGVLWFIQFCAADFFPQLILCSILIIASFLFIIKKRISYYFFMLFFIGVIIDSIFTFVFSSIISEGFFISYFLPVSFSIICIVLINLRYVKEIFEFDKKIKLKYLIVIVLLATLNTLNTRFFNTRFLENTTSYNKSNAQ